MNQLLLISSTAALALLVAHSWRTRGRAVTLAFFIGGALYGLLRENAIWLLVQHLSGGAADIKPYIPEGGFLPEIGHAHLQVAVGWVFTMYLAWTISELILRRIAPLAGRVFMIAGLASLFVLAICYAMETTAVAVGWWYWLLPTRSTLFGNVPTLGMEGWFTVVPDFLLPFLVIVCSEGRVGARHASPASEIHGRGMPRPYARWLWVLAFPLHIGGHMLCRWVPQAMWVYYALELLVVAPMMFSKLKMARGEIGDATLLPYGPKGAAHNRVASPISPRYAAALPAIALAILFGVVTLANVSSGRGPAILMTEVPLLMLCLLAWAGLPAWGVAVASLAAVGGWHWIGARALWSLAPAAAFGFLWLHARRRESLALKLLPVATVVALSVISGWSFEADVARAERYFAELDRWDRLALEGKPDKAQAAGARAAQLRPDSPLLMYRADMDLLGAVSGPPEDAIPRLQQRMKHLAPEFEEIVRRDPEWLLPRMHLAHIYLLQGKRADAARQYREIYPWRNRDGLVVAMLGYHLLREGEAAEAERACERAASMRRPPVEALINLGVIRFSQKCDDDARKLWEEALRREPGNVMAKLNRYRLDETDPDRAIDARWLARQTLGAVDAPEIANNLAAYGVDVSPAEEMALLIEATQFNPNYLLAQQNLVRGYLDAENPRYDRARALWHARRAVAIARDGSHTDAELSVSLLLLGRALEANGRPEEARRAFEEGRSKAPREPRREFLPNR